MIGGFSGFKARLLLAAGFFVFCGLLWGGGRELLQSDSGPARPGGVSAANWTTGPGSAERALEIPDRVGEAVVEVGLSFLIAMVAASVLRSALKTGLTLLFVGGLAIWFLDSQGHVDLWGDYLGAVQEGGGWLKSRSSAVAELCRQHLPSTGAALVGFGFGLKR